VSVALFMDEHVPGPITTALRRRGVDVLTAQDDGSDGSDDPDLLDRAGQLQRVLFTRDTDFLVIAADRQRNSTPFSGIVYADQNVVSWRRSIDDLEIIAKASDWEDWHNKLERLPL
jgi:predicted nuclease of predicted toxin-antitoxin system